MDHFRKNIEITRKLGRNKRKQEVGNWHDWRFLCNSQVVHLEKSSEIKIIIIIIIIRRRICIKLSTILRKQQFPNHSRQLLTFAFKYQNNMRCSGMESKYYGFNNKSGRLYYFYTPTSSNSQFRGCQRCCKRVS